MFFLQTLDGARKSRVLTRSELILPRGMTAALTGKWILQGGLPSFAQPYDPNNASSGYRSNVRPIEPLEGFPFDEDDWKRARTYFEERRNRFREIYVLPWPAYVMGKPDDATFFLRTLEGEPRSFARAEPESGPAQGRDPIGILTDFLEDNDDLF